MSRMPSPMDQLKVRIAFTPATMRKRCGACEHLKAARNEIGNLRCGKHGLSVSLFSICNDFSPGEGINPRWLDPR